MEEKKLLITRVEKGYTRNTRNTANMSTFTQNQKSL